MAARTGATACVVDKGWEQWPVVAGPGCRRARLPSVREGRDESRWWSGRSRDRIQSLVTAVTRTLHAVVGGEVADAAEFLVDPADL